MPSVSDVAETMTASEILRVFDVLRYNGDSPVVKCGARIHRHDVLSDVHPYCHSREVREKLRRAGSHSILSGSAEEFADSPFPERRPRNWGSLSASRVPGAGEQRTVCPCSGRRPVTNNGQSIKTESNVATVTSITGSGDFTARPA